MILSQVLVQPFRLTNRRDVDHARSLALAQNARDLLVLDGGVHRATDLEAQVGACEAGDREVRVAHPELTRDVAPHLLGGGRGEGEQRRPAESPDDGA